MKHLFLCLTILASMSVLADDTAPTATGPNYSNVLAEISSNITSNTVAINRLVTSIDNLRSSNEANTQSLVASISNLTVQLTQTLNDIRVSMNNTILIPTPDYDNKEEVESGFKAVTKGFVMMTTKSAPKTGYRYAFINNVRVFIPLSERATEFDCVHYGIYPVATGDVITLPNAENYIKLFWVPAK